MKYCIADPPYLGVANKYYGPGASDRRYGSYTVATTEHPDAAEWDEPGRHIQLVHDLHRNYDGFAIAANQTSLPTYLSADPNLRIAVWYAPNYVSTRHRVHRKWEPVLYHAPSWTRNGPYWQDVLTANVEHRGHIGSKPQAWTRWVLGLMGVEPGDTVDDLFPGSGAVSRHLAQQRLL